jgi:hypothetical protein
LKDQQKLASPRACGMSATAHRGEPGNRRGSAGERATYMDQGGEASGGAGDALERVFELHGSKGSVDCTHREREREGIASVKTTGSIAWHRLQSAADSDAPSALTQPRLSTCPVDWPVAP